ncbi:MAG: TonB-dependent receptor plug domain-containing protein, partial [Myxococcota bacterium]
MNVACIVLIAAPVAASAEAGADADASPAPVSAEETPRASSSGGQGEDEADEVRVLSVGSVEDTMERSAEAVDVLDVEDARTKSADLGEVLARGRGIGVRRGGGLGSSTRLSLGGLTGAQVRTYVDGVPLEFSGYAFGL